MESHNYHMMNNRNNPIGNNPVGNSHSHSHNNINHSYNIPNNPAYNNPNVYNTENYYGYRNNNTHNTVNNSNSKNNNNNISDSSNHHTNFVDRNRSSTGTTIGSGNFNGVSPQDQMRHHGLHKDTQMENYAINNNNSNDNNGMTAMSQMEYLNGNNMSNHSSVDSAPNFFNGNGSNGYESRSFNVYSSVSGMNQNITPTNPTFNINNNNTSEESTPLLKSNNPTVNFRKRKSPASTTTDSNTIPTKEKKIKKDGKATIDNTRKPAGTGNGNSYRNNKKEDIINDNEKIASQSSNNNKKSQKTTNSNFKNEQYSTNKSTGHSGTNDKVPLSLDNSETLKSSSSSTPPSNTNTNTTLPHLKPNFNPDTPDKRRVNAYIFDFLTKSALNETARAFVKEAVIEERGKRPTVDERGTISDFKLTYDVPRGFFYEWWQIFWDIFNARTNRGGSDVAKDYYKFQMMRNKPEQFYRQAAIQAAHIQQLAEQRGEYHMEMMEQQKNLHQNHFYQTGNANFYPYPSQHPQMPPYHQNQQPVNTHPEHPSSSLTNAASYDVSLGPQETPSVLQSQYPASAQGPPKQQNVYSTQRQQMQGYSSQGSYYQGPPPSHHPPPPTSSSSQPPQNNFYSSSQQKYQQSPGRPDYSVAASNHSNQNIPQPQQYDQVGNLSYQQQGYPSQKPYGQPHYSSQAPYSQHQSPSYMQGSSNTLVSQNMRANKFENTSYTAQAAVGNNGLESINKRNETKTALQPQSLAIDKEIQKPNKSSNKMGAKASSRKNSVSSAKPYDASPQANLSKKNNANLDSSRSKTASANTSTSRKSAGNTPTAADTKGKKTKMKQPSKVSSPITDMSPGSIAGSPGTYSGRAGAKKKRTLSSLNTQGQLQASNDASSLMNNKGFNSSHSTPSATQPPTNFPVSGPASASASAYSPNYLKNGKFDISQEKPIDDSLLVKTASESAVNSNVNNLKKFSKISAVSSPETSSQFRTIVGSPLSQPIQHTQSMSGKFLGQVDFSNNFGSGSDNATATSFSHHSKTSLDQVKRTPNHTGEPSHLQSGVHLEQKQQATMPGVGNDDDAFSLKNFFAANSAALTDGIKENILPSQSPSDHLDVEGLNNFFNWDH